jgi:hypothetical protein
VRFSGGASCRSSYRRPWLALAPATALAEVSAYRASDGSSDPAFVTIGQASMIRNVVPDAFARRFRPLGHGRSRRAKPSQNACASLKHGAVFRRTLGLPSVASACELGGA